MKKALIVTTISGFVPQFEMNDVKILQDYGYEVHYASNFNNPVYRCDQDALEAAGIILHHIDIEKSPRRIGRNLKAFNQIKKLIDSEHIDMVHCHNPMGAVVGRLASHFSRRKPYTIYTAHGFHFYKGAPKKNWILYYTVERFLARYTDMIITINKEDYTHASHFKMKYAGRVEKIHGVGVDINRFSKRPHLNREKREELGIPMNAFHIVTVAELNENKNQKIVIEALSRLDRPDIYYTICGKGENEEQLNSMIRKLGLENRVQLLGYRTDVDEILQTADCFAFPSRREGLGIAAVEALATGVPLIVSDNRGTREYAKHSKNSMVCRYNHAEDFVEAIAKLKDDVAFRAKLAEASRKSALKFGIENIDQEMRKIYKRIN